MIGPEGSFPEIVASLKKQLLCGWESTMNPAPFSPITITIRFSASIRLNIHSIEA